MYAADAEKPDNLLLFIKNVAPTTDNHQMWVPHFFDSPTGMMKAIDL
jgi:hypothetical protein